MSRRLKRQTVEDATAGLRGVFRAKLGRVLEQHTEPELFSHFLSDAVGLLGNLAAKPSAEVLARLGSMLMGGIFATAAGQASPALDKRIAEAKTEAAANLDAFADALAEHVAYCARVFCKPELLAAVLARHELLGRWPLYHQWLDPNPQGWDGLQSLLGAIAFETAPLAHMIQGREQPGWAFAPCVVGVLPEDRDEAATYSSTGVGVRTPTGLRAWTKTAAPESTVRLFTRTGHIDASPGQVARWARTAADALVPLPEEPSIEEWKGKIEDALSKARGVSATEAAANAGLTDEDFAWVEKWSQSHKLGEFLEGVARFGVHGELEWLDTAGGRLRVLPPLGLALLYLAERDVERDAARQAIAIDAGKAHLGFVNGTARARLATAPGTKLDMDAAGRVELLLPDENGTVQLKLPLVGESLNQAVVTELARRDIARDVRSFRGGSGLLHWLAFNSQLSTVGARKGWVRWTVDAHLEALGYSKTQIQNTPELREEAVRAVLLFTRAELVYNRDGERISWPLVLVGEKRERHKGGAWELDGLVLAVNQLLYGGVRQENGKLGTNWYPAPLELAKLNQRRDVHALLLAAVLPFHFRYEAGRRGNDTIRLTGQWLLDTAQVSHKLRAKNPAEAWGALERALERAKEIGSIGSWEWDAGAERTAGGCVTIHAPAWASDRLLRGVEPVERPAAAVLLTGAELLAWRTNHGLTQRQAAERLGVGVATIQRAEGEPDKRLGPALREALGREG